MSFISIENVFFSYEELEEGKIVQNAVDGVTLAIEKGEFVAIIGHNGCGKSTLAKHLNAMLLPDSGRVLVDGDDTSVDDNTFKIREKVGLVLQNPDNQLVAGIVEEDVAFGPENLGVEPAEIRRRVDEALRAVDMYDYREHAPYKLSGGQKQRVAIAGVLAMDEAVLADRVVVMDGGKILTQGTPEEVFSQVELLKKHRLDVPQSAELAYRLRGCGLKINKIPLTQTDCVEMLGEAMR